MKRGQIGNTLIGRAELPLRPNSSSPTNKPHEPGPEKTGELNGKKWAARQRRPTIGISAYAAISRISDENLPTLDGLPVADGTLI